MYIQAILSTAQTKLRGKLKLSLNLGICGSGMLRVKPEIGHSVRDVSRRLWKVRCLRRPALLLGWRVADFDVP